MTEQLKKLRNRRLRRHTWLPASHGADVIPPSELKNMQGAGGHENHWRASPTPGSLSPHR